MFKLGKFKRNMSRAGIVLSLMGTFGVYTQTVSAETNGDKVKSISGEEGESLHKELLGKDMTKLELRDQTFTLGRLRVDKDTQYEYRSTLDSEDSPALHELIAESHENNESDYERLLEEDFEGYIEVTGRIKSGGKVWLEVALEGEPMGYISQGRLEVKPIIKTEFIETPEDIELTQETTHKTPIYSDLTFLSTQVDELSKGEEYKVLGLYEAQFYRKPVESIKVETSYGDIGWVKRSDIKNIEDLEVEDKEELEEVEITLKEGSILYDAPTYLERSKVQDTLNRGVKVKKLGLLEDNEVKSYYYKVLTKDGEEGYIEVNDYENQTPREIKEEIDTEEKQVRLKSTQVLSNLPKGVEGARDESLVSKSDELTVIKEVRVVDVEEDTDDLEDEDSSKVKAKEDKVKEDKEDKEDKAKEDKEDKEGATTKAYYELVYSDTGREAGYVLRGQVEDVEEGSGVEDSSEGKASKEGKETSDKKKLAKLKEDKKKLMGATDSDGEVDREAIIKQLESMDGWEVGKATGRAKTGNTKGVTSKSTRGFIDELTPYAQNVRDGGLYPSVMIGQAIHESAGGRSSLARNDNNLFGIKGSYKGMSTVYNTGEHGNGGTFRINAGFRSYPTLEDGINDYVRLLNNSNYTRNGVVNAISPLHSLEGLKRAGYATDPLYVSKVWRIIETYDLTRYD